MSKIPSELLAKSKPPITLKAHLLDTENAVMRIFRLDGRWGRNWCRLFRIQGDTAQQKFLLNLRVAALLHDKGKANEDFYAAVSTGHKEQTLDMNILVLWCCIYPKFVLGWQQIPYLI